MEAQIKSEAKGFMFIILNVIMTSPLSPLQPFPGVIKNG
jgi:hypothetical protein